MQLPHRRDVPCLMSQQKQCHKGKDDNNIAEMLPSTANETECQLSSFRPSAFTNGGGDHGALMKCKDVPLPKGIATFTMTNGGKNIAAITNGHSPPNVPIMCGELPGHTGEVQLGQSPVVLLSKQMYQASIRHPDADSNQNGFASACSDMTNPNTNNNAQDGHGSACRAHHSLPDVGDLAKRQRQIDKKILYFIKRIRRVQAAEASKVAAHQLTRFVDDHHKCLEHVARHMKGTPNTGVEPINAEVLQSEDIKNLSTAALVSLVQRLQTSQGSVSNRMPNISNGTVAMSKDDKADAMAASGILHAGLRHVESVVDSDATESSSGGESDDDGHQMLLTERASTRPLCSAAGRWIKDRAAVACRWTWLQTQVSDLEFQIRQCSNYVRRAHLAKNMHRRLQPHSSEVGDTYVKHCERSCDQCTTRLLSSEVPALEQDHGTVNKDSAQGDGSDSIEVKDEPGGGANNQCTVGDSAVRCKPFFPSLLPHKIVRLSATCANPTSEVRRHLQRAVCQCNDLPTLQCSLCCCGSLIQASYGDLQNASKKEHLDAMDPCYHSVLSLRKDIYPMVRCDDVLRKEGLIQRLSTNKFTKRSFKRKGIYNNPDPGVPIRKKLKTAVSSLMMSRISNDGFARVHSLPGKQRGFAATSRVRKSTGRRKKKMALEMLAKRGRASSSSQLRQLSSSPLPPDCLSSLTQSAPASMLRDGRVISRRRGESAFDINNIVIPYSMAAATRVEKLQYKEIITPKWREIDTALYDQQLTGQPSEEELEDLSDETMFIRHTRMENQEKKRYTTVFKTSARRSRLQSLRADSDPSTPEPWSPESSFTDAAGNCLVQSLSVASPAASASVDDEQLPDDCIPRPRSESISQQRLSSDSLLAQGRVGQCARLKSETAEEPLAPSEEAVLLPWPKRTFPLSEDDEKLLFATDMCSVQSNSSCLPVVNERAVPAFVAGDQPKWTVIPTENEIDEQEKQAIVLKLARQ